MPKPALPLSSPKVQETVPALIFYSYFDSHINSPHRNLSPFAQLLLFFPHINANATKKGTLWTFVRFATEGKVVRVEFYDSERCALAVTYLLFKYSSDLKRVVCANDGKFPSVH